MIELRAADGRGHADHGWLKSCHSFSFADYLDPRRMGFGNLRVLNEDRLAPGTGFGCHAHHDVEILAIVLEGALALHDGLGPCTTLVPGEVLRLSAGRGVTHSEVNPAGDRWTRCLQVWIRPQRPGLAPGRAQRAFDPAGQRGRLRLVAAADGRDGALTIHADAALYIGRFDGAEATERALDAQRLAYVHLVRGTLGVNGYRLRAGDALALDGECRLQLSQGEGAEVLVLDLAR